jgi:hypothetical protein
MIIRNAVTEDGRCGYKFGRPYNMIWIIKKLKEND